jgi:23S rRNA (adenine2503-C2)-methyltransferase
MGEARPAITSFTPTELEERFEAEGIEPYRARQILRWIWERNTSSFEEMTDLPKGLRARLAERHILFGARKTEAPDSDAKDRTQKQLLELSDGKWIECVRIPARDGRQTVCLSTQVGCPLACRFCASGLEGVERNLYWHEIVDQYLLLRQASPAPITNVVFMGMGEPFLNYDELYRAIGVFTRKVPDGAGLSPRRITISTSGIVPGIERMASEPLDVRLSVSLHAPRDEIRTPLMPINKKYPIEVLMRALREYVRRTGRLVTFEYILLDGVNDSARGAEELADLLDGLACKVNLIPFNSVPETPYRTPPRQRCDAFAEVLKDRGIRTTLRVRKGADIDAACGQLRLRRARA